TTAPRITLSSDICSPESIGKIRACQRSRRSEREGEARSAQVPAPSGEQRAGGAPCAVGDAREQGLAATLRVSGKDPVHRRDRGRMKGAERGGVQELREDEQPER